MTRAVAAHVTRSHRAVAYLLLLVYHLVSVHGRIGMSLCVLVHEPHSIVQYFRGHGFQLYELEHRGDERS